MAEKANRCALPLRGWSESMSPLSRPLELFSSREDDPKIKESLDGES